MMQERRSTAQRQVPAGFTTRTNLSGIVRVRETEGLPTAQAASDMLMVSCEGFDWKSGEELLVRTSRASTCVFSLPGRTGDKDKYRAGNTASVHGLCDFCPFLLGSSDRPTSDRHTPPTPHSGKTPPSTSKCTVPLLYQKRDVELNWQEIYNTHLLLRVPQ